MRLYLVRHGETIENAKGICQGQMEGTLTQKGIEQAIMVANFLKSEQIDFIYTSDLTRAVNTAIETAKHFPNAPIHQDKRLRERFFGSYQGKKFPENRRDLVIPPDAETDNQLIERVKSFYDEIVKKHINSNILIVSHGVTLRTFIAVIQCLSSIDEVESFENASIALVDIDKDLQVQQINRNLLKHL